MSGQPSLTIENLLSLLVVEWQSIRYSPMGRPTGGVSMDGGRTSISLAPSTMHDRGCPRNFGEFFEAAKSLQGMNTKKEAFMWYCRTRLHYSCSTVCVTFYEFIVPELQKRGIEVLGVSTPLGNTDQVNLSRIKVKGINFYPESGMVHRLRLVYMNLPGVPMIEQKIDVEVGSHNTLQCSESGRVFDATIGQLTGKMTPQLFDNFEAYKAEYQGEILRFFDSSQEDIEGQKLRDIGEARTHRNPKVHPSKIAKRVVDLFLNSGDGGTTTYCAHCLGIASLGSKLLRCGRCKKRLFCSKTCQSVDWLLGHKLACGCKS